MLAVLTTGATVRRTRRFFPSDGRNHRQYSFYHPAEGRRLSRPSWQVSHRDGLPARRQSPIAVLIGPSVE